MSIIEKYERDWVNAKLALDNMVADCAATKTTPPNNYWEREREARRKLDMARAVVEAINGQQ